MVRILWAFLLPERLYALPGPAACVAGVVLGHGIEPFVFYSRSVPVSGCLSSITSLLSGLKLQV